MIRGLGAEPRILARAALGEFGELHVGVLPLLTRVMRSDRAMHSDLGVLLRFPSLGGYGVRHAPRCNVSESTDSKSYEKESALRNTMFTHKCVTNILNCAPPYSMCACRFAFQSLPSPHFQAQTETRTLGTGSLVVKNASRGSLLFPPKLFQHASKPTGLATLRQH